jgi:hypothetical protein
MAIPTTPTVYCGKIRLHQQVFGLGAWRSPSGLQAACCDNMEGTGKILVEGVFVDSISIT